MVGGSGVSKQVILYTQLQTGGGQSENEAAFFIIISWAFKQQPWQFLMAFWSSMKMLLLPLFTLVDTFLFQCFIGPIWSRAPVYLCFTLICH